MCGHVSLLCLCLLFVSSIVQGGQENLPSTWTRIVREDAQARLDDGKEGAEKTFRIIAEQLSICNARSLVLQNKLAEWMEASEDSRRSITQQLATYNARALELQTKLDEEKAAMEYKLRMKSEELVRVNSRMLVLQTRLEDKKEGVEQIREVYTEQLDKLNIRLEESQQKLITASLNHQKIAETLRADNLRLKHQLEETTTNFERLEGQLSVTTGELKTKTIELMKCDVESTTLREKVKQITVNNKLMNQELKNQTMNFQQDIFKVILNATNLQTDYVKKVTKQLEQDFSKINTNVSEVVLQNKADFKLTSEKLFKEMLKGNTELIKKSDNILQELTSTKTKIDAGFSKMTQERDSKYNGLQSKQNQILQDIASSKSEIDDGFVKMTQERGSKYHGLQSTQNQILKVIEATKIQAEIGATSNLLYFNKDKKMNWHDAQKFCFSRGQKLVTIDNTKKNQLIIYHMKQHDMSYPWLGGIDEAVEGTWRWIGTNQTLAYSNWGLSQPGGGTGENCMKIWLSDGTWHDYPCSTLSPFICEL